MAWLAAGCGPETELPGRPRALQVAVEAPVATLDPRFVVDAHSSRASGLVHCSLARPDGRGGWEGDLARSWSRPSARSWVFELRGDALFHDGRPVRAADVVATYRSVLQPAGGSPRRAALGSVASVEADGPGRVRFVLAQPDAAFLEGAGLGVLPRALAEGPRLGPAPLPGCGPYRVADITGERLRLESWRRWHGGPVRLDAIVIRAVPDTVMRTLELRSGSIDLVQNALDPDAVRHLDAQGDLRVHVGPYDAFQYLGLHHRHPALSDPRVRRAIAMAIDREALVRHVLAGQAEVATGLLPPHHAFHQAGVRRYPHDPARARRLLDRAGFPDPDGPGPEPRLRLRYSTSTVELRRRIAEVIAADLGAVGIEVGIESYEWATFFDDIARGDYDLYSLAWIGIGDPDLFRQLFASTMTPPAGNNRGFFANRRLDRLLERGRREEEPAARHRVYARVQRLFARQLPYVPLWWPKSVVVSTGRLQDFKPHPAGDLLPLTRARLSTHGQAAGASRTNANQ